MQPIPKALPVPSLTTSSASETRRDTQRHAETRRDTQRQRISTERDRDRQKHKHRATENKTETERETETERGTETERERETERETETERESDLQPITKALPAPSLTAANAICIACYPHTLPQYRTPPTTPIGPYARSVPGSS
eukprot:2836486-Rhodomonas_salina.1